MKLVIQNSAREWRGNEAMTTTLALALRRRGHEVVVSCHPRGVLRHRLAELDVPHSFVRPGGDLDVWSAVRFASWLRREDADVVMLTTWKRVPWGAWAARRAGVRRVTVRLGIARDLPPHWWYQTAFRRWVDGTLVNSREIRDRFLGSAPWLSPDRVRLIHNGIAVPPAIDRAAARADLGIPAEAPVLVGVGGLEPRKGFDRLLEAFAGLSDPAARLLIVGSGPDAGRLRERAAALDIADRVRWLGQRDDVPAVLAACDLFVLSSLNEGMAVAMLEAMAMGLLVVGTPISGVREALAPTADRDAAGWVAAAPTSAALREAIEAALDALRTGAPAEERRGEARYRAKHWFSEERMVDEVESFLSSG